MSALSGIRVLVVDDEPLARADLARLLGELPDVGAVECADDGDAALRRAADSPFDAVFLDVRMPGLDGLELARVLRRFSGAPELVFVSAHDDAAVEAFELRAVDYLRKPVARRRAAEAVARVRSARSAVDPAMPQAGGGELEDSDVFAVSALGGATRLLARGDVRYVSSYGDYVRIHTAAERHLLRVTLAEIERRWAPHGFVRVHRQYVVNLHHVVELRPQLGGTAELAFDNETTVPVARRHTTELVRHLGV